ncbi:heme exporter protein CcmB [Moraxella bovoculi]|uniref:Heme exporter protein B n=1 Tax=Moraxella bovoculi 237 TaxID=743974 RepID=A0A066ULQ1_9GAMM|nr:heme exporter protein CcmB [Moraxella bovoculi]AKG15716.2 ABC transporter permease [Moraxella bovoculi]KDN25089.1 heme ABC transporter permease CcmB [Moraxella bovoculi 237]NSM11553.1 ABC transporter permease [Moraxella bovoculi]
MMKNAFGSMLLREWRIKRQGAVQWLFPLMIFLIIITLFPLAVGSESALLLRLATSAVWIAALLSLVMGVDDLFKADMENGTLAQLVVSGSPLSVWVFARLLVHWLFSAGFVAVLSLLVNPLFNMPFDETLMLMLSIIVGSPLMLMLSAIASSLVLSLKNGAVLVPLIALPMQLPVLIFATGAVDLYATGLNGLPTLALLGAMSIIAVIVTPWVVAQILKMAWSS